MIWRQMTSVVLVMATLSGGSVLAQDSPRVQGEPRAQEEKKLELPPNFRRPTQPPTTLLIDG